MLICIILFQMVGQLEYLLKKLKIFYEYNVAITTFRIFLII